MKQESDIVIDILIFDDKHHYELEDTFNQMGITIYKVSWPTISGLFKCCSDLNKFFRMHHDYNIIHAHTSSKAVLPLYYAKKYGINIRISHSHNTDFQTKNLILKTIGIILKIPLKRLSTHYFACSTEAAIWLFGKHLVEQGKVSILKNGIFVNNYSYNIQQRQEIRQQLNFAENDVIIGNVGRFTHQKNHDFLIDIFNSYHSINKNSKLLLIGAGELVDMIKEKVSNLGLSDSVIFFGFCSNAQKFYQAFDIFLMPSLYEGLPFVGIEAQAAGLPCFFSDTITKELKITQSVYFISLNKTPDFWAEKIDTCMQSFKRLDVKDYITAAGYNIECEVKKLIEYYKKIANE